MFKGDGGVPAETRTRNGAVGGHCFIQLDYGYGKMKLYDLDKQGL